MDVVAARRARAHHLHAPACQFARRFLLCVALALCAQLLAGPQVHAADAVTGEPLDINIATAEELAERLPGIGQVKAQAIVDWRESNGPFDSVDALISVPGIGAVTLERLRPLVTVGGAIGEAADARERATVLAVRRIVERAHRGAAAHVVGVP